MGEVDETRAARTAFRAFVRAHHPDAGGDPETFARKLAQWQQRRRHHRATARRYDAPVVFVEDRPLRWLRDLLRRARGFGRRTEPRVR